jgi:folate-binding protein YgfZ
MTSTRTEWNGHQLRLERGYGLLGEHYAIWTPMAGLNRLWRTLTTAGAAPAGTATLEAFRIAEGIPLYGVDMVERDLPQETSQMRALHFNKGCYLGQEIVERIRSRGKVHRHLRSLELEGPLPPAGTDLRLEGESPAGIITSAAALPARGGTRIFALAMLREEAELKGERLNYGSGMGAGTARTLSGPPAF